MSYEKASSAAEYIKARSAGEVRTAVVLGSGLGAFAERLTDEVRIPYPEIPGFSRSTVEGHAGQLVIGKIDGVNLVIQQGRFHYYEGYDMEQVTLPIRAFRMLGVQNLILTNAAGSLDTDMTPGSLMLISDHINGMGVNPLRGQNDDRFGPRFPDMTAVYDRDYQQVAHDHADAIAKERFEAGLDRELTDFIFRGVYCALSGPTYETPAEVRMYRMLGADAVGMSTVPEAVTARHMGMRILGISCITNLAAGISSEPIDHAEVMETGKLVSEIFGELITRTVKEISENT